MKRLPNRIVERRLEAGIDEVGRGCLAGPVVAAAVILPTDCDIDGLHDSKRLTAAKREALVPLIEETAIAYAIAEVPPSVIDEINILQATFRAMNSAVRQLEVTPEYLLVDGHLFRSEVEIPYETIKGGDDKVASIAAASILAKVYRDRLMCQLAEGYPQYQWERNAGYGTPAHLAALRQYGTTPHHRKSFAPCQPSLF